MKKFLIIALSLLAIIVVLSYFGWKYALSKLDEVIETLDYEVVLIEMCQQKTECLEAVKTHYPACRPAEKPENATAFFSEIEPIVNCLSEKSNIDLKQYMQ